MITFSRRDFLRTASAAATVAAIARTSSAQGSDSAPKGPLAGPVIVSSANGLPATEKAAAMILAGQDTLDAAVAGVNILEEDPNDNSVGYGGLPNEDGVVELDSSVMHGPTRGCGSVAALRNIKTPSRVAQLVMQRTDHIMLVGEGALRFAKAHGFKEENLLTEESRRAWLRWREEHSNKDNWLPPPPDPVGADRRSSRQAPVAFTYGTITCLALNTAGQMSGVTTTSGLSWKLSGRVGDSPIIGAGLYLDNDVGAAGSTGRGEANIKICGAHTIVELMRGGASPSEAVMQAIERVITFTVEPRLLEDGKPNFDLKFYALAKDGRFAGASIWSGAKFAVYSEGKNRLEECAYALKRPVEKKNHARG